MLSLVLGISCITTFLALFFSHCRFSCVISLLALLFYIVAPHGLLALLFYNVAPHGVVPHIVDLLHYSFRHILFTSLLLRCCFSQVTILFPSCCSFHIIIPLMFQVLASQPLLFFLCCCFSSCVVANPLALLLFCFAWLIWYFPCPCHV
jgi:hypothetical protein